MSAYCWVENAHWFGTRDTLWTQAVEAFAGEERVRLALPQLDLGEAAN